MTVARTIGLPPTSPARLVLGTAQFGMAYGITNRRGQASEAEVSQVLAAARAAGITHFDTAAGYGISEALLGKHLAEFPDAAIVTKTAVIDGDTVSGADIDKVRVSLERSLVHLRRPKVEALLLHHGLDLLKPGGERLAAALDAVKSAGLAARIGVSIYDGAELHGVLARFKPDIVQLPLNLFDQRLLRTGHIARLQTAGIEVHARSPFLQGVLLGDRLKLDPYFAPFRAHFARYADFLTEAGLDPLHACLGFALSQSGVDRIVFGVTGLNEFREILAAVQGLPESLPAMMNLGIDDSSLVDPRNWKARSLGFEYDNAGRQTISGAVSNG